MHRDSPQAPSRVSLHVRSCKRNAAWHADSGQNQSSTSHVEHAVHASASSSSASAVQNGLPQRHALACGALRFLTAAGFFTAGPAAAAAAADSS